MSILDRLRRSPNLEGALIEPVRFPQLPLDYPEDVFEVPVLVVAYFPSRDGIVRASATGDVEAPLETLRHHTRRTTQRIVEALELGSIYHGYKDGAARPSLRYTVLETLEFVDPLPTRSKPGHTVPMTDYAAIMKRVDAGSWVRERGVKEIWLWGYHGGVLDLWESNMAGPFGDISNSDRDLTDLPVFDRTYTVYHYNYARGAAEAVEDHMHQIEAILRHVDPELFWDRFVGKPGEGRCGWAHFPPNGRKDYDWANTVYVNTDIEDWAPAGGPRQRLNSTRWRGESLTWFIYWMENLPGRDNQLIYGGRKLSNWWRFVGDWDAATRSRAGLVD